MPAYLAEVSDERVVKSVACEFGADDPVAEATWVQQSADEHGFPHAFIGAVDLTDARLADRLDRYGDLPIVRAVRQPLYWANNPLRRLGARPDFLTDPNWLKGFELVAERGLTWDLLLYSHQLREAHELVRSFSDTRFVLEATGWPIDQSADGFERWQESLAGISQFPNVAVKLPGLALIFGPSATELGPWVRAALRTFRADQCMFATHLPIDRLLWSFPELMRTMRALLGDLPVDAAQEFFSGCGTRNYSL